MNLNILTSGLITNKFGIRPALMCATRKDLSRHSVVRIVADNISGWIGIAYGHLITGAKCQIDNKTINGLDALEIFLNMDDGMFDLIQLDMRLMGDDLTQEIGVSIDELLDIMKSSPEMPIHDILKRCKKGTDAIALFVAAEEHLQSKKQAEQFDADLENENRDETDESEWSLGDDSTSDAPPPAASPSQESVLNQLASSWANRQLPDEVKPGTDVTEPAHGSELANSSASSGFVLLSQEDHGQLSSEAESAHNPEDTWKIADKPMELMPIKPAPGTDLLGAEVRAELHDFVKQKFGIESKSFFDVDIEKSADYDSSLVLKDLEVAMEKSKDLSASGSFFKLAESVEKMKRAEDEQMDQATSTRLGGLWLKDQPSGRITGDQISKRENLKASEAEQESSRKIFETQVKKSSEIDTKAFISSSTNDAKMQMDVLKEQRLRQGILITAVVCLCLAGIALFFYLTNKQNSLETASHKLIAGNLTEARQIYERILLSDPENWEAYLGHALSIPDDYSRQINDYRRVLELKPDEFSAALALAKVYYKIKDYPRATEAADRAARLNPKNIPALKLKGDSLLKQQKFKDAIGALEAALALGPRNPAELYYQLSCAYQGLKQTKSQEEYLQKASEAEPNNTKLLKELAQIKFEESKNEEAEVLLRKAIDILPSDGELHYHLAKIKEKDKDFEQSTSHYARAIELGYHSADCYGSLGMLFFSKHMYDKAKSNLDAACEADKENTHWKKALDVTDRELELEKSRLTPRRVETTDNTDAVSDFVKDSELQGDYVGKAYDLLAQGRYLQSIRLLKAAVRINPDDMRARRYLATAFYYTGEYAGACTQFSLAARSQALNENEQLFFATSLMNNGKIEQSIQILNSLLEQQPDNRAARIQLIHAYSRAGFTDHVQAQCQEGMRNARNQTEYAEFQSLLKQITTGKSR